ncbi:TolC family protein [Flammeovirga kamogawensis]|uniref:TolC family protein n=1 Tax=Flammeovirga kamogawensis TaxID=373891 RepID=UPI001F00D3F6|nr:TolC family protein [Flammeovirga kamogawensis]
MQAQERPQNVISTLEEAIEVGVQQNGQIKIATADIEVQEQGKRAAIDINKTKITAQYGQYNSFNNDLAFEINQNIDFPTVYSKQKSLAKEKISGSEIKLIMTQNEIKKEIRAAWYELTYLVERQELLLFQDSLYQRFLYAATLRYETQATNFLEKASAETQVMQIQNDLFLLSSDIQIQQNTLRVLLQDTVGYVFKPKLLEKRKVEFTRSVEEVTNNPLLAYAQKQIDIANAEKKVASAEMLPGLNVGYFNNSMIGAATSDGGIATSSDRFQGVSFGVAIPLFYGSSKAKVNTAKLKAQMAQISAEQYKIQLEGQYTRLGQQILQLTGSLEYYETKALPQVERVIDNAQKSFENGAINYVEYFQNVNQSLELKYKYLTTLNNYNQAIIQLEYVVGN